MPPLLGIGGIKFYPYPYVFSFQFMHKARYPEWKANFNFVSGGINIGRKKTYNEKKICYKL
jgi:hypothetical protein